MADLEHTETARSGTDDSGPRQWNPARLLLWGMAALVLSYALLSFFKPIRDTDFWWHLKTGEQIVNSWSLPAVDTFTYPAPGPVEARETFLLRSYWLYQVVLYLVYAAAGLKGAVALRVLVLAAMVASVWARFRRQEVSPWIALPLISAGLVTLGELYTGDRPQMVSFLGASLLVGLMERIRDGGRPNWLLPPLMLLWANLHGGYVVGDLLLLLFAAGMLIQNRHDWRTALRPAAWAMSGIAASLVNPCGWQAFLFTFNLAGKSTSQVFVYEFMSSLEAFRAGHWHVAILWLLVLLTVVGLAASSRRWWPDILLFGFCGFLSVAYLRNTAFFTIALLPLCGYYLDRARRSHEFGAAALSIATGGSFLMALTVMAFSAVTLWGKGAPLRVVVHPSLPVKAAGFIQTAPLRGNMFNDYEWGGYLLWRLHPGNRVFIDGRVVREPVLDDYIAIARADTALRGGRPAFKALLDDHRVDFIIQPIHQAAGTLQPLMKVILNDPGWVPVYLDDLTCIFLRKAPQNAALLERYAMDRLAFAAGLLDTYERLWREHPAEPRYLLAKGELLIYLGRLREAEQALLELQRLEPANAHAVRNLTFIRTGSYGP